jgi:tetratricopeptide (TPR) repeat protein
VHRARGDLAQAETLYRQALESEERMRRKFHAAINYTNLGHVYRARGDASKAKAMYRKALQLFREMKATARIEKAQSLLSEGR